MNPPLPPAKGAFLNERRRRPRHKVHTPAYARIQGNSTGFLLDLNTIVDLSEEGMCIQTPSALNVDYVLNLCLELAEASGPIYTVGRVVWSNRLGRTGIVFGEISEASAHQLKRWLFLNAISGAADSVSAASHEEAALDLQAAEVSPVEPPAPDASAPAATDHTALLSALSAVRHESEMLGPDINRILQLVVERALIFIHGSGAAVALSNGMEIVCRACAGEDAPPVGTRVSTDSGFSSLCLQNGQTLICTDSESDSRVDAEVCRVLGIRSLIAAPIFQHASVIGLIEVFSREPNGFGPESKLILEDLSETVAAALRRTSYPKRRFEDLPPAAMEQTLGPEPGAPADEGEFSPSVVSTRVWFRRALLILALLTVVAALLWVLMPRSQNRLSAPSAQAASVSAAVPSSSPADRIDQSRKLAQQGDAALQLATGIRYAMGDGVKQDYSEAARWFSMAAAQGNVSAQAKLAAYYFSGTGVPRDLAKSYFWALLAQAGGDKASQYRVEILASRMTHEQLVSVQEQANQWLKDHQVSTPAP